MKNLGTEIRGAIMATLMLVVVCCGLYPLLVFGFGQILFHDQANGSLIVDQQGMIRGSRLLGQQFTAEKYFQSRPSAAGNGYDATSSGGSNLGPTSQKLNDAIAQRIADYRAQNHLATNALVPADAVTASGSGLEAPRVANVRGWSEARVLELVRANTDAAGFGVLGDPGVNVLKLNLALDEPTAGAASGK